MHYAAFIKVKVATQGARASVQYCLIKPPPRKSPRVIKSGSSSIHTLQHMVLDWNFIVFLTHEQCDQSCRITKIENIFERISFLISCISGKSTSILHFTLKHTRTLDILSGFVVSAKWRYLLKTNDFPSRFYVTLKKVFVCVCHEYNLEFSFLFFWCVCEENCRPSI